MNKIYFLFITLLFNQMIQSQNYKINAVILDKETKTALRSPVNIFNDLDRSFCNSEGTFSFTSSKNEINFSSIYYKSIQTTFDLLKGKDTIFMESNVSIVGEVLSHDTEAFIQKVIDSLSNNFSTTSYTNDFFLRSVLKTNREITKIQDLSGIMTVDGLSETPEKNKIKKGIEILNMRKISIHEKKDIIDFDFPSFNDLIVMKISLDPEYFRFVEAYSGNKNYRKIVFYTIDKDAISNQTPSGYVLVNKKDYAIIQYFITYYDDPEKGPYKKVFFGTYQYRTTRYEKTLNFSKNTTTGKYYLNNQRLDAEIEFVIDERMGKISYYNLAMEYFTTKSFTNETVNSNFPKDLFKTKFPYSEEFWKTQDQLPLTNALKNFIDKTTQNKKNRKVF